MPPARRSARAVRTLNAGGELALGGLDELLGFHLRRAQGAVHRDFLAAMGDLDFTQKQIATLFLIEANPGVSQIQIANELDMDRATMMAVVDRLEARGFLVRRRSKSDRRRQELFLTPRGQAALKTARARIAKHEQRLKRRFNEDEIKALCAALRRLYE